MGGRGSSSARPSSRERTTGNATEREVGRMEREGATSREVSQALRDRDDAISATLRRAEERGTDSFRRGRVQYDDDLVMVISPEGNVDYRGLDDYNPYRDDDWRYSESLGYYTLEAPNGTYRMGLV